MVAEGVKLEGGCLCGAIRYVLTGPSMLICQCCCKDCQKATGTGHTTIIGIPKSQLEMTGEPVSYTNTGDTGGTVTRHFCRTCGGRLYTSGDLPGDVVMVQAGSLDDPNAIDPERVIYFKDAPRWDRFDDTLPKVDSASMRAPLERTA